MAGLLFKDFVGIKGKLILWILSGCTVLFFILRFAFPGNAPGAMGELYDTFLILFPGLLVAVGLFLPSMWTTVICKNDEKNNTRRYTRTLPLDRNAYIASKYIFIGIVIYVLFSLENIWIIIFNSCAGSNSSSEMMAALSLFIVEFCGISIMLAAIELPFFITLGVKKGTMIKTSIMEGLGILVIVYMLFGNLEIFRNFNIVAIANWCREHSTFMMLISIISPAVDLFIYWISYRITCKINKNREVEING